MASEAYPELRPAHYPFTAILGQAALQTALLISAVDPAIGGVLVRGEATMPLSTGGCPVVAP